MNISIVKPAEISGYTIENKIKKLNTDFRKWGVIAQTGKMRHQEGLEFVTNQTRVNGSCTPHNGTIRLSHELLKMSKWVLDYVIMHEMTHLQYPNHSKGFWAKVGEYKYTERARGF